MAFNFMFSKITTSTTIQSQRPQQIRNRSWTKCVVGLLVALQIPAASADSSQSSKGSPQGELPDGVTMEDPIETSLNGDGVFCFDRLSDLEKKAASLNKEDRDLKQEYQALGKRKFRQMSDRESIAEFEQRSEAWEKNREALEKRREALKPLVVFLKAQTTTSPTARSTETDSKKGSAGKELQITGDVDLSLLQKAANTIGSALQISVPAEITVGGSIQMNQNMVLHFQSTGPIPQRLDGPISICADLDKGKYEIIIHAVQAFLFTFNAKHEVQISMQAEVPVKNRKLSLGSYTATLRTTTAPNTNPSGGDDGQIVPAAYFRKSSATDRSNHPGL